LPIVRKLVLVDKNYQAADEECHKMEGPWNQNYEPVGDLLIEMDHGDEIASYRRSLDLDAAVAKVEYTADGVRYQREVFASFPNDVIVARIAADQPGKVSATLRMKSLLQSSSSAQGSSTRGTNLLLTGKAPKQSLPEYVSTEPAVIYSDVAGEGMHFASGASAGERRQSRGAARRQHPCGGRVLFGDYCRMRDGFSRVRLRPRHASGPSCREGAGNRRASRPYSL